MPSEAQSQEPRDRGPAPPVTRAGRSAQLAKAAAISSALERRSRGRPRKDGGSGRSPPPPPPPPPPKSRKKGRSRGRAQVEDEESMDATEENPPQKTEVKEVKEKASGRRRSTSRRKSNTNPDPDPEPSRDRLSPEPEKEPDPPPPEPPVPESNPEPAPSAEEERTSPAPAAPLPEPASSPGEEPRVSFPSPEPSPVHSPTEVDCSPSGDPVEAQGGGASPSLSLSPCSSPPVSPCPRLEDEDSLSPLFQLSEDSGGSPTPSLGHTKKRLKQCAFCSGGDEPPLGQGRLVVFGPTPGYIPLHILNRRASSDRDNDCHDHCYRGDQATPTCSSPEQCESSSEFVEQLGPVGLPHDINVQSLFDPTGQCCAHLQCAAWSEGVCRGEGQSLLYVDKAIDSGSTQVCAFCRRLGASLRCREASCGRSFHFPCAAAAGALQDWKQRHTLCTRHAHTASPRCVQCVRCPGGGDVSGLLMCCCCGDCYHGSCLDPPLAPSPLCRAGWQCPQCRVCQSCRLRGDEGVLLVCDRCDKAYHSHCLTPPLDHTPSASWRCKNCRVCRRCGVRSSGQWANHPFLCESCDPALPCPLCDLCTPQDCVTCVCCYRSVHTECIVQVGEGRAGSEDYICSTCRPQEEEPVPHTPPPHGPAQAPPLSPTQAVTISQPPSPGRTEAPPISPAAHSPVQLICSEPLQGPTLGTPSPTQSPAPPNPEPSELQQCPAPPSPEPTEFTQSPPPPNPEPSELQQCPAPPSPEPTEFTQSPPPPNPEPSDLQQSPTSPKPEPTELQHSPAPTSHEPIECTHSPAPLSPEPTELQQSPAPPNPEPTQLPHSPAPPNTEPTQLPHSPAPPSPKTMELQHSPAQSISEQTDIQHTATQHSPAPLSPETTKLQPCPASPKPELTGLQHSPAPPSPKTMELQHRATPSKPEPNELQHSPVPPSPELTEPSHSPAPPKPETTELQHSPTSPNPESAELQHSPAPPSPESKEVQHSPAPAVLETVEPQQSAAPPSPEPTEVQHSPAPPDPETAEPQQTHAPPSPGLREPPQSPAPMSPKTMEPQHSPVPPSPEHLEPQQNLEPCRPGQTKLQQSPAPFHPEAEEQEGSPVCSPDSAELKLSPEQSHSNLTEKQPSLASSHPDSTEAKQIPNQSHPDPAESPDPPEHQKNQASSQDGHLNPSRVTLLQAQCGPSHLSYTLSNLTQDSTEDQLLVTESQQSGHAEPEQSPPPHSPAPEDSTQTQLDSPCRPASITDSQLQHSPPQVGPSLPQSPTKDAERTLDQESPGSSSPAELRCEPAKDLSTLDQDLPSAAALAARGHVSLRPVSAPCSPSPSPLRAAQCSLSQPASPVQAHSTPLFRPVQFSLLPSQLATKSRATKELTKTSTTELKSLEHTPMQLSPNLDGQTLESSPTPDPSTFHPDNHDTDGKLPIRQGPVQSPRHNAAMPTPESLVHMSTSIEHSSLASSPCADRMDETPPASCINLSPSHDRVEGAASPSHIPNSSSSDCPKHTSPLPTNSASTVQACSSPRVVEPTSPRVVEPTSPRVVEPASPRVVEPTSPRVVEPASPRVVEPTSPRVVEPASPRVVEPASPRVVEPASPRVVEPASPRVVEPASPRVVESTSPRVVESASPRKVDSTSPRQVEPTSPRVVEPASPRVVEPTSPRVVEPTSPRLVDSTSPRLVDSTSPRVVDSTSPTVVEPTSPRVVESTSPKAEETRASTTASPVTEPASSSVHPFGSLAPVGSLMEPASPSAVSAISIHPISCEDKDVELEADHLQSQTGPGDSNHSPDSRPHASPVQTEAESGYSLMGLMHDEEKTGPLVCSFTELTQTQASLSPTRFGQSNLSHVHTTCSPSQTSPLPAPASSSPPHCQSADNNPASSSVSPSLSHSGQTNSCSDILTDVSHSPPRSSPAGQASPVHIQSTCSGALSGSVQRQTPSLSSTTYSSFAHATVGCVSPPHSPAQASETYRSPQYSPAPDTGTSSGPTVAQLSPALVSSSLDVEVMASSSTQSSVLPTVANLDAGLVKPTDSIGQTSPAPAVSVPEESSAVNPSRTSQSPNSPLPTADRSAAETQQSPSCQRPAAPVEATSPLASLNPASPVRSSPTQDNTAMPSTSNIIETAASSPPPAPSQVSPPPAPEAQPSSVHSSPVSSPVCGPLQSDDTQVNPSPTSPLRPEAFPSPGPGGSLGGGTSPGPGSVSPILAAPGHPETSPSPGPASPVPAHPGPSPGGPSASSPEQRLTETESAASLDVSLVEQPEEKTEEEEVQRDTPQMEERDEAPQMTEQNPEEEKGTQEGAEQDQEEAQCSSSDRSPLGLQLGSPHTASPLLPQPAPPSPLPCSPHSALPPQQTSSPLPSPPPGAGSVEVSPHRTALLPSCSPHSPPPISSPLEDRPQEETPPNHSEAATEEAGPEEMPLCHVTSANHDGQSQSQFELDAKDEHQSHAEPLEKEEEPPAAPEPIATHLAEEVPGPQPMKEVEREEEKEEVVTEDPEEEDQSDVEEEDPVSLELELDPSLDMEVMALMTSSSPPPSLLHLSSPSPPPLSRRGAGRTLRPPPCSSRPLDDLSIRLRQSPFSTEASPETSPTRVPITPPPLSPPSPPLRYSPPAREFAPLSKAVPLTVLPLTPKIGMGKPAISKRKFSPGRARIRQGSWWSNRRAASPPSSSQDSMGEAGWDSPKPRPPDSPLWSMRAVRGTGFPGRRRSRGGGVGGGRGGRGRSRLKTQECLTVSPGCVYVEPFQPKEEEENSMHNTVVMFSTSDHFTLKQDMCVVCGSFGQGAEGRLLACSQCGQCYHPYCVNVKITRVVLTKGWRCLECTVCEACGEASDPGRLLLCDDCDISYHTYCLDPPLHTVPKGAWKCKWCVWCVQCGSSSPGLHCDWMNNYSRCGPCASLSCCPLCQRQYTQDDLILQCQQCDRWVHAVCQGLNTEDEVEVAADEGFDCSLCRTNGRSSYGRPDGFDSPYMAQIITRIREPDSKTYTQDGVCLTESGLSHLQSLVEPLTSPRRYRRCKPKLKLRIINQNSVSVLQTPPDPDPPAEHDPGRGDLECDMKSDSSPERDHAHDDDVTKEPEVTDGNKKRKRKPYRPGIGGFMVRQRGAKAGPSRIKLCRKDSTETLPGRDEDFSTETVPAADQATEKAKKRYRKKKTKLEEAFPSYLQEAFFGRDLLDRSRQADRRPVPETPGVSQSGAGDTKGPAPVSHGPSPSGPAVGAVRKQGALPMSEEPLLDLSDVLNTDPHILATGHTAGLDIGAVADDLTGSGVRGQRAVQDEPLDAILSPELDKMVTDGAILSKLYKIPELEGKDVEEVFTAVLSPNSSNNQPSEQSQHTHSAAGSKTHTQHAAFPRLPVMNGLMGASPHFPNAPMMPSGVQTPAGYRMPPPESPAPGMASANQAAAGDGEQDVMSTAQRGMLKWEKEETLGEMATVAPVLYCNTNFPQLREQYPEWSTRVKQIAKLWRKASSQDRAPFVQKARDNRAAQRINKVQLSNDPLKRHPPSLQPPPPPPLPLQPGPYDPAAMETDGAFKDPLRPRESEQEQEWKFRQQMRQKSKQLAKMEASQKLEQVKHEQLQQRQLAGRLSPEAGSPAAPGGGASPLHPSRQHLLPHGSGAADDVFLRPQAPPPSGFSSLPHSPLPSSPLHQPPSSPQMFSPPSSRPSSPWDSYSKGGAPRPASSQPGGPTAPQQQRHSSLSASPAHDAFGSPAPSPDSKTSEGSRTLGPQPGVQQSRSGMMSPPSGSGPDLPSRLVGYQRPGPGGAQPFGRGGEAVQGGLFKAPMPPQQPQPEGFGSTGGRRDPSRPTDLGFPLSQSQDAPFPSSPLSGLGSPHRSPYSQQIPDPFAQHSPLTSRPSPDPYANPQTPGTPRPHSDPSYLATPPALRLDQYNQPPANRRPSPSHPNLDPYASSPGTPRAAVTDRFPRSPGSQRSADPYAQPPGTPRPSCDPYAQQPSTPRPQKEPFSQAAGESFTSQPAGPGASPLVPGLSADTFTTRHQSPGRPQQDSFPRTPSSQTPKHPGMSEDGGFLPSQTPGHDPFEQGHMTPGHLQTDKTATNEMAALAGAGLDGAMSVLPQLGDSEEKLRQRQRLRQLILRQQQQKSALRQEKGLQEAAAPSGPAPGPAPGPATPRHWSQVDSSAAPPADPFGRPPPPYPGTVRPAGAAPPPRFPGGFPGEPQRGFTPSEAPFPRQSLPRELGVRGPVLRFGVPPGAPAVVQDSFLRPPQGSVPVSGLGLVEGVPVLMRRPVDFTGIRPLPAPGAPGVPGHMVPGAPQPFLPRSLPLQQHSIMGQPYIELRHRAPENRLRLSLSDPEAPLRPGVGGRAGEAPLGPHLVMEPLNQQPLGHGAALTQSGEAALPGPDGMEEHLEGEDSAVKDLEDVEVKDLVDLNLNLDPEDGKEDLDLGPNDLHLDDFLLSGKFDLIAYADPELNLEDKKDMFNEELDLGEAAEEGSRRLDSQVKQEVQDAVQTERDGPSAAQQPAPPPGGVSASRTLHPASGPGSGGLPALQTQEQAPSSGMGPQVPPPIAGGQQPLFQQQQRPFGPSALFPPHPSLAQGPPGPPLPLTLQPPQPRLLLDPQAQLPHPGASSHTQSPAAFPQNQNQEQHRHLLLEEQPLLLQDLLDQERQEQQQQKQMQALIRQRSTPDSVLPTMDYDSISDPIMKAKMVVLTGINKVMTQGSLGLNPMVINRFQVPPAAPGPEGPAQPPHLVGQDGKLNPQLVRPSPPSFGPGFVNESQRRQYEEWLGETQRLLQMQQRLLEDQIAAHRKTKKSLSAKQRTAKKAGRALAEEDAMQLRNVTEQQGTVQKQLEQIRKQQKDHAELIEDYRTKQQRAAGAPPVPQPLLPQPMASMQPRPAGPGPARLPNVPPGWTPGGRAPVLMGQRMPLRLPNAPQAPPAPRQLAPGLAAPTAGFPAGPRGPSGGPAGDPAAPPQVKFDDNNPFSEGFQERERRERLREQQERQRVQLMQEVERHRALQQRLELEQQGLLGAPPGARAPLPAGPPAPAPPGDGLSQMPFFSSELPQDFLQSPPASRPPAQHQAGAPFPQQAGLHQGFTAGPLHPGAGPAAAGERGRALSDVTRPSAQGQGRAPSHAAPQVHRFGHDSSSSSPSFPCSSSTSLAQLYSDILPDDKPTKKRSRKREGEEAGGGARTPLSSHSDDITAPPTPAVSDTSCSTPTRGSIDQSDVCFAQGSALSGLAPSSELERQLSIISAAQQRGSAPRLEVKEEREEGGACGGGVVKMEEGGAEGLSSPSPPHGGDAGKELLRQLLKERSSPATTPSPTGPAPPTARRQLSNDSIRSEEEDGPGSRGAAVAMDSPDGADPSGRKKTQRCKRPARPDKDRAPPKNKRRKKEEEERLTASTTSSSDPLMTHLRQLSVLPLMEPVLGVDLSLFPPYGSSSLGRDSRLSGSFGNASLDGVTDYYSQLIYKNNLSNPPTPPASLPPTPPPVARQKLVNGFATTEELARKDISEQEVKAVKQKGEGLLPLNHASKTVDVPASLPTPPHNNQEELRVQDSGRDSPDGFVPSSSPESEWDTEVSRYPDLSFIKLEPPSPCPSPTIPMMPCAWGKGSAVKQEVKAEPHQQAPPSCSNTDLVTIAITLNPVAAQNVAGVMAAVAELLRVPVPADYQLSPERSALALLAGVRVPLPQGAAGSRQQRAPAARPQCCSYCKVLLGNGVRIVRELKQEGQSRPGPSLVFCSPNCSALHSSDLQGRAAHKAAVPVMLSDSECPSRTSHQYTSNMSSIAVHSLLQTPSPPPTSSSPPLAFPPAAAITMETRPRMDSLKVKVKLKPRPRAVPGGDDSLSSRHGKRMKSLRWRRWSFSVTLSRGPCIPNEAVATPTEEEVDVLLKKFGASLRPDPSPKDQRRCCFCNQQGDGRTDGPARLLNLDLDLWVHLNCALWSSEVYETQAGALINVELALRRSLTLRCAHCQRTGATSGCNRLRCTNTYHFTCALQAHCTFFKDKTMLCHLHKPRTVPLGGDRSSSGSPSSTPGPTPDPLAMAARDPYDCELRCFSVFRRVFVQRDEARQIAAVVQRGERQHTFRVGSLLFRAVGRLLPQQMKAFHNKTAIFPIGYTANRIYWSMRHSNRRCKYSCCIEEQEGQPLFKVKVVEKGYEELTLTGPTPKAVWDQILEPVSQMRSSSGTLKLFPVYLKGEDLFGLTTSAVTRIIESLPGVETCERYTFRYGRNPLMEWPLAFNPSGSARSEPKACQTKRPTLLTSVAPRCQGSVGAIVGLVPGVLSLSPGETVAGAHQGRHSKSSQYRRMKAEWKTNVYLARSRIQGLGLYAARDIEKCTMVIEYIGTIIRSEVANRKERLYESQNRGVYMFRIDNDFVIDATITGGPARYINHSCSPNCITEVVTVEKENKIIISSCRRIQRGEELSYDYKFDLEDDQHKIPCHCGAVNCRKWMN